MRPSQRTKKMVRRRKITGLEHGKKKSAWKLLGFSTYSTVYILLEESWWNRTNEIDNTDTYMFSGSGIYPIRFFFYLSSFHDASQFSGGTGSVHILRLRRVVIRTTNFIIETKRKRSLIYVIICLNLQEVYHCFILCGLLGACIEVAWLKATTNTAIITIITANTNKERQLSSDKKCLRWI